MKSISLPLTPEDRLAFKQAAELAGLPMTRWIRLACHAYLASPEVVQVLHTVDPQTPKVIAAPARAVPLPASKRVLESLDAPVLSKCDFEPALEELPPWPPLAEPEGPDAGSVREPPLLPPVKRRRTAAESIARFDAVNPIPPEVQAFAEEVGPAMLEEVSLPPEPVTKIDPHPGFKRSPKCITAKCAQVGSPCCAACRQFGSLREIEF